ncbi:structural maintenance of chromosomes protein 6-like [Takifugu flavidus]|uniref:structural maintenance of chromosomes protein 6-like n=1 Tax=Takifugu flavidus TaxID=433684 RepID=UPI002543FF0B|nr:structural maintenance of chromosomes protein 6-like [Takifugu flavidus]
MSKRKSISTHDKSTKRVRFVEEEEDSEDADDRDQDVERLSPQVLPSGDVSDVGIVKSITLNNFMCHANLGPFAFGSNVNFIVGKNGSGKSAILTGLIVALGGNAQATNRGSSLKGFVKEGESFAVVSITLNNMGKDAYKPEVYGQAIVIDQKITREGIRTYKLKSQSGHIISTKKEDLVTILDYYNIQVNNPVTILTQEMSKYFLHSKGGAEKYKFFMKATQLGQMKDDFVHIKSTKSVTVDKVEQHSECLKDLKRDFLEKEDRYKSLASVNEMYTKLEELKKQMAWALVGEVEKEFEPMKEKLESDRCATNKFNEKVDEWKKKVEVAEGKQKQSHEQLEEITQQISELQSKCTEFKTEVQRRNADLKSCEVTVHRHKAILRDLEKDKAQLSSKINDLSLSISQATGAESQARMERIAQIEAALEDLTHHTSTLGQQIEQYQHSYRHAIEGQGKMKRELEGLQKSIDANRRQLQSMESSRSNRLQRFGDQMPALLAAIDEAHKKGQFKHRPRGPLGYLISLKDPELALSIEICLKNLVQAFTCDNYDDERVLKSLMTKVLQHGRRPAIITSRFFPQVHDTQRRAVNHPDYPSVLQALEIEDPVVANCLIDQRAIECILLIKNRTEARRVMQGKNPPQNCTSAFSVEGDQIFTNRSYTADQTRANFLSKDVEEGIRHLKREMETQKVQAAHIQQQIRSTDKNISENQDLLRRTQTEQKTTEKKTMKLQLELTDLKNVEEPQSEDLRPLEEDLQEIIAKISSKRAEYDEARAQMAELKSAFENAEQEYKQHKQLINTAAEEADVKKEELSKTDQEVMKCKHHEKHYEERRNAHLCSIKTLENNVASKEKELQESIAKAKEICPEQLVVRRTARSLDAEITRLKVKIATQREHQGDREEIVREYHEALESYANKAQQIKNLNNFIKCLDRVMDQRLYAYTVLRRFVSAHCKYYFDSMLAQRGFTGNMTFDHKNETLSVSVQPGQGNKADLNDMRCLSGGERSFSTVCFVLSLWPITEAPFRCLDEFDVYMDMVNRRISIDMMLKVADSQKNRQFIFLTPQSMSSLPECRRIHIVQLNDPVHGQTQMEQEGEGP